MEKFKFIVFSIIILALVGILGYWAVLTIEPGGVHADLAREKELEDQNVELQKEISALKDQVASLQDTQVTPAPAVTPTQPTTKPVTITTTTTTTSTNKNQSLINDLQKLIDDKVFMKEKSQGSRVGTVQNFLNIYFKTSKKVDNDYGAGTKTDVMKFQKDQGLLADGEAGPGTFAKMIQWLEQ